MNTSTTAHSAACPAPTSDPTPNPPTLGGPCEGRNDRSKEVGSSGRAISARNATTHGLFARDVVLPALGEDPAAFDALLQQLMIQLPPRHLLERHYLEQIAAASWRLRRLHRWQAQIYEDDALTEDQRLDKLDKVLRHETALTRQIDRAIRMMNRDLTDLFHSRARDDALYFRNVTDVECRQDPDLAIDVQQLVWKQARGFSPNAGLADACLDNTRPVPANNENCQNEPPRPPSPLPPPLLGAGGPPLPFPPGEGWPRNEAGVGPSAQNCQNEPPGDTRSLLDTGTPSRFGEGKASLSEPGERPDFSPAKLSLADINSPEGYLAYRKREQEMYCRQNPDAIRTAIDWDDPDVRRDYGAS